MKAPLASIKSCVVGALAALAILFSGPALAEGASSGPFDFARAIKPETASLANGMEIVVISDHRVPVANHMLWYRVGAADEEAGKSGLAHFFEHLLFKGTEAVPDGGFDDIISRNGGELNAFTSWDFTAYYARVAKDRLPIVMELEADRMRNLILTDEVFLPERDVILEERARGIDNNPAAIFNEQLRATLFQNHRYGVPIIGWAHEVGALTQSDAFEFYNRYYAPNNAILIVSGDVTMEEILPLAEKYYGHLKPSELPERVRATEPPHMAARRLKLEDVRVRQPSWRRLYLVPSYNSGGTGEAASIEVLSAILGEGPRSRLYQRLILKEGKAVSAGTSYYADTLHDMTLTFYSTPRPGVELGELEVLIDEEIARIISEGVTEEEVTTAVKTLMNDAIYSLDDPTTLNYIFGQALTTGGEVERVLNWQEGLSGVTAKNVQDVARKILNINRSVTGELLPAQPEQQEGAAQ